MPRGHITVEGGSYRVAERLGYQHGAARHAVVVEIPHRLPRGAKPSPGIPGCTWTAVGPTARGPWRWWTPADRIGRA